MDAPISVSLSALTVAMMISYFSPLYISASLSICCLVVALFFAAAGSRMAYMLVLSVKPASSKRPQHAGSTLSNESNCGISNAGGSIMMNSDSNLKHSISATLDKETKSAQMMGKFISSSRRNDGDDQNQSERDQSLTELLKLTLQLSRSVARIRKFQLAQLKAHKHRMRQSIPKPTINHCH